MQLKLSLDRDDCNPINLARESELCFVIRHIDSNDRLVRTNCLAGAKAGIDACDPRPAQDLCFDPFLCSDSIIDGVNGNLLPSETLDVECDASNQILSAEDNRGFCGIALALVMTAGPRVDCNRDPILENSHARFPGSEDVADALVNRFDRTRVDLETATQHPE